MSAPLSIVLVQSKPPALPTSRPSSCPPLISLSPPVPTNPSSLLSSPTTTVLSSATSSSPSSTLSNSVSNSSYFKPNSPSSKSLPNTSPSIAPSISPFKSDSKCTLKSRIKEVSELKFLENLFFTEYMNEDKIKNKIKTENCNKKKIGFNSKRKLSKSPRKDIDLRKPTKRTLADILNFDTPKLYKKRSSSFERKDIRNGNETKNKLESKFVRKSPTTNDFLHNNETENVSVKDNNDVEIIEDRDLPFCSTKSLKRIRSSIDDKNCSPKRRTLTPPPVDCIDITNDSSAPENSDIDDEKDELEWNRIEMKIFRKIPRKDSSPRHVRVPKGLAHDRINLSTLEFEPRVVLNDIINDKATSK